MAGKTFLPGAAADKPKAPRPKPATNSGKKLTASAATAQTNVPLKGRKS